MVGNYSVLSEIEICCCVITMTYNGIHYSLVRLINVYYNDNMDGSFAFTDVKLVITHDLRVE